MAPVCPQVMVCFPGLLPTSGSCVWFPGLVPGSGSWDFLTAAGERSRETCDYDQPSTPMKDGWNKTSSLFCSVFKCWFVVICFLLKSYILSKMHLSCHSYRQMNQAAVVQITTHNQLLVTRTSSTWVNRAGPQPWWEALWASAQTLHLYLPDEQQQIQADVEALHQDYDRKHIKWL